MKILGLTPLSLIASITALTAWSYYSNPRKKVEVKNNPRQGGWSKKKISNFNKLTGSKLKIGVFHDPVTLEDFRRKGSWATRHYKRKNGWNGLNMAPLKNSKGELLPFSTQAKVWGEKPPETREDQRKLVKLGEKLLGMYKIHKKLGYKLNQPLPRKVRKRFKRGLSK
jgi:hypothetical protein